MTTPPSPKGQSVDELADASNLTRAQFLIWMGQQLTPDSPLYNMAMLFSIDGEIDPISFQTAFAELVSRSDAMRTIFRDSGNSVRRETQPKLSFEMPVFDFRGRDAGALSSWASERAEVIFQVDERCFDSALIQLEDRRWAWFLNKHHLITDGWSMAVIFTAMQDLYGHALRGSLSEAAPLPTHEAYVDFERSRRESRGLQKAKAYWEDKARSAPDPIDFYGRSPLASGSTRTDRITFDLGRERSGRLRELVLAKDLRNLSVDLSLFNLFSTLLFAYLARVSGRTELAILAPTHNRPTPAFKNTVGLFIEILPLHAEVDEADSLQSLYEKVAAESRSFLMNAQPGTSRSAQNRSYSVLLNYINASFPTFNGLPIESDWVHANHGDSNHSLRLQVHDFDASGSFRLHFDLNCEVFDNERRGWVVQHFVAFIDAFLEDRTQSIAGVRLSSEQDIEENHVQFNQTDASFLVLRTVLDEFETAAKRTPDAPALSLGAADVSYGELNLRADTLALRLRQEGIQRGSFVAIYQSRSIEMIVSLLAVLKAGRAYVPLDPSYPKSRIEFILQDSGAELILTTEDLEPQLAETLVPVMRITQEDSGSQPEGTGVESGKLGAPSLTDPAYLIYTSGSTGTPKGAVISHGNLAHYVEWARRTYLPEAPSGAGAVFPLYSSFAFDLTVTSIFVPITSGGQIRIYPEETGPDLAILQVLTEDTVDIIKLTPAHLALIRTSGIQNHRVRTLIVGGEDLKTELAKETHSIFGGRVTLFNEYGPTEATVACMIHRFDPQGDNPTSVSIGRPIDRAKIYVLDSFQQPVPLGFVGEIYIGGPGVASGYHNRPELTAERFVADPFSATGQMYRSGDLARFRSPGKIEFLGRDDGQVKIRGSRIELGEIEAALERHPQIGKALVMVAPEPRRAAPESTRFCERCGLASNHPDAEMEGDTVCGICRSFDSYRDKSEAYFRDMDELREIFAEAREASRTRTDAETHLEPSVQSESETPSEPSESYDCMMLLSGGKDSTYALYQLAEMGLKVLAFNLDNGYISDGAKANIQRATDDLGIELIWGQTPAMNKIFVDSLKTFSNVCQGCFKTIFTLATTVARERGIPIIVTGLSRGQIFETRIADLLRAGIEDPDEMDAAVIEARKAYHRMDDVVAQTLGASAFEGDEIFEDVRIVDFYRYTQVELAEMLEFLDQRAPWVRPADTGRSTNCLINDTGILLHKKIRGYHNYALPYSWDVRLGHKTRDAALAELDDEIDLAKSLTILEEIGYTDDPESFDLSGGTDKRLAAYYVPVSSGSAADGLSDDFADAREMRTYLGTKLPEFMIPSYFIPLASFELTANGKVDRGSLPDPRGRKNKEDTSQTAPKTPTEIQLGEIWKRVLRLDQIGIHDHFLEIGGDSILGLQIVSQAQRAGLKVTPRQVFDHPTIAELAVAVRSALNRSGEAQAKNDARFVGTIPLTPIQHWFLEQGFRSPGQFTQSLAVHAAEPVDLRRLTDAFAAVTDHHDVLRARFHADGLHIPESGSTEPLVVRQNADGTSRSTDFDLAKGPLVRMAIQQPGPKIEQFRIDAHGLIVDAISWNTLLLDLAEAYDQLGTSRGFVPPPKTMSFAAWSNRLHSAGQSGEFESEQDFWREMAAPSDESTRCGTLRDNASQSNSSPPRHGTTRKTLKQATTSRLVSEVPPVFQTTLEDALLSAFAESQCAPSMSPSLRIDLERHGRELLDADTDLSRTLGCCTSLHPFQIPWTTEGAVARLKATKEAVRRIPSNGIGYGILRYLGPEQTQREFRNHPCAEILFQYLGQTDRVDLSARFVPKRTSEETDNRREQARAQSPYPIEVSLSISDGELQMAWSYDGSRYDREGIEEQATRYVEALHSLLAEVLEQGVGGYTPSDVAGADISQDDLDDILGDLAE